MPVFNSTGRAVILADGAVYTSVFPRSAQSPSAPIPIPIPANIPVMSAQPPTPNGAPHPPERIPSNPSPPPIAQELLGYAVHDSIPRGGGYLGMVRMQDPVDLLARGEL